MPTRQKCLLILSVLLLVFPVLAESFTSSQNITFMAPGLFAIPEDPVVFGRITAVERRSGALFQEASLQPAVDLSRLEEVLILMTLEANASSGAGTTFGAGASFEAGTGRRP